MAQRLALALALAACVSAIWVSEAAAFSTGQFTRAEATSDWSRGSFAGSVTWTDCNSGCKSWLVLIYAEPSVYTCQATDWLEESDPNIRQVWNSGGQTGNKTIPFEVNDVALIPGVYGQRLCMIGVQSTETEFGTFVSNQLVTQTLLKVATPTAPTESVPPPSAETAPKGKVAKACLLAREKVRLARKRRNAARRDGLKNKTRRLNKALRQAVIQRKAKC